MSNGNRLYRLWKIEDSTTCQCEDKKCWSSPVELRRKADQEKQLPNLWKNITLKPGYIIGLDYVDEKSGSLNFNVSEASEFDGRRVAMKGKIMKNFEQSIKKADIFVCNKLLQMNDPNNSYLKSTIRYDCLGEDYLSGPSSGIMLAVQF